MLHLDPEIREPAEMTEGHADGAAMLDPGADRDELVAFGIALGRPAQVDERAILDRLAARAGFGRGQRVDDRIGNAGMLLQPPERLLLAPVEMDPDELGRGLAIGAGLRRVDGMAVAVVLKFDRETIHAGFQINSSVRPGSAEAGAAPTIRAASPRARSRMTVGISGI
jgi:hypothetical protein